jgi:hypothetical protein
LTDADYVRGKMRGMDFARQARFPQFEDRQQPCPDGPVTTAWMDGFAEGILACRDGEPAAA